MEKWLDSANAFGARYPIFWRGDVPDVAEGVSDAALTVAPVLIGNGVNGCCASLDGARVSQVRVRDIEVGGCRARRILFIRVAKFNDGIADADFGMHDGTVGFRHANALGALECGNQEFHKFGGAIDEDVRRDIGETWTAEMRGFG